MVGLQSTSTITVRIAIDRYNQELDCNQKLQSQMGLQLEDAIGTTFAIMMVDVIIVIVNKQSLMN